MKRLNQADYNNNSKETGLLEELNMVVSRHQLDDALTLLWANAGFYRLLGYETKEAASCDHSSSFSEYIQNFQELQDTLASTAHAGERHVELYCCMRIQDDMEIRVNIAASIIHKPQAAAEVMLCYVPIKDASEEKDRVLLSEKEMTDNFEWMMSVYSGNVYISDMDTYELLFLNKHSCDTLQSSPAQLLGRKCYEAIQGLDAPCPFCTNAHLKKDETYNWEFYNPNLKRTFMIKDRMLDWFGHRARIELSYDMYSEEYKLAKKDQEREAILKTIPAGMIRVDARDNDTVLWYNGIFLDMIGYTPEQFEEELQSCCSSYMHPEDLKRALQLCRKLKHTGDNVVLEARAYTRMKEERVWTVTLCYISGEDSWDGIPSLYSIGLDITEERKQMERLRHKAEKDALTGIYNRETMQLQIHNHLIENPDTVNALFMIDTDDFKKINDTHGHITGDLVLSEMASGMKKIVRKTDIVGRIGGDEFTIFMKDISSVEAAKEKAEELLIMFRRLFTSEKNPVRVTCSMGIAMYPEDGEDFQELYDCADKALYQAKMHGKNGYCIFNKSRVRELLLAQNTSAITSIESKLEHTGILDNLAQYVFRILYQYENMDEAVNLILEIVGKQFDVSRSYIFENTEDGTHGFNTYEWCSEGIASEMENLQNADYHELNDYESLFQEDRIFYCRDIQTLSQEQAALFADQGIYSILQCAFYEGEIFSGFIGFDECTGHRFWTKEEVSSLSLIAQILATFLKVKRLERRITKHYDTMAVQEGIFHYES